MPRIAAPDDTRGFPFTRHGTCFSEGVTEGFKIRASGEFYPSIWDYVETVTGSRVLLAESDPELRHFFATGLRRNGYAVLAISDGEEALAILSSISRGELPKPDVAIMDVHMSVHSGVELLAAMRRAGWTTPVIMLSLRVDHRLRSFIDEFRVFTCLTKPVSSAKLSRAIESALVDDREKGPAA